MMGGGFGGSTLHLVRRDDIRSYTEDISDFYKKATGMEPRIFELIVSNGLETLEMGQSV
jgi:galactokinase